MEQWEKAVWPRLSIVSEEWVAIVATLQVVLQLGFYHNKDMSLSSSMCHTVTKALRQSLTS